MVLGVGRLSELMTGLLYAATGRLLDAIDRINFSPIRKFAPNMLISLDNFYAIILSLEIEKTTHVSVAPSMSRLGNSVHGMSYIALRARLVTLILLDSRRPSEGTRKRGSEERR